MGVRPVVGIPTETLWLPVQLVSTGRLSVDLNAAPAVDQPNTLRPAIMEKLRLLRRQTGAVRNFATIYDQRLPCNRTRVHVC